MEGLFAVIITLIGCAISLGLSYLITKAAAAAAIRDSMWSLEISIRNAVKNGVLEAAKEREQITQTEIQNAVRLGVQEAMQAMESHKAGGNHG